MIEPLECRIAPATFYVSGTSLTINNSDGDEISESAAPVGATKFIRLRAGDLLVFDTDGDQVYEPFDSSDATQHDVKLVKVASGRAMVFFRDADNNGRFGPHEISGVAVSDKFGGQIFTDVNGDIATALDAVGNLQLSGNTVTIAATSSISGLTVTGRVADDVYAGKNLSKLSIGSGLYSSGPSVESLVVGVFVGGNSVDFGTVSLTASFLQAPGAAGGSISGVTLAAGALFIDAGQGANNPAGAGGAGGSITDVHILSDTGALNVRAGRGGDATGQTGAGGAGGNIANVTILAMPDTSVSVNVYAGAGGQSENGVGGKGGSLTASQITLASSAFSAALQGGEGGRGETAGGVGGALTGVEVYAPGTTTLSLGAGAGGDADAGTGALGGALSKVKVHAGGGGSVSLRAGFGGDSAGTKTGGTGGSLSATLLEAFGSLSSIDVSAGPGGGAATGQGGTGGALSGVTVRGGSGGTVTIGAGSGGSAQTGGDGGALSGVTVTLNSASSLLISGGMGTAAGTASLGAGGDGGALSGVKVAVASVSSAFNILAGSGGNGQLTSGGAGGALSGVSFIGTTGGGTIAAGNSGTSSGAMSKAGGKLSGVAVDLTGPIAGGIFISAGHAGAVLSGTGAGGAGGSLSGVTVTAEAAVSSVMVTSGKGSAGSDSGAGGSGGALSGVKIFSFGVTGFSLMGGDGGLGGANGAGGKGGAVSGISIRDTGAGNFTIFSGQGKNGGAMGNGGDGGMLSGITATNLSTLLLKAGDGGQSSDNFKGGKGGDAKAISFTGGSLAVRGGKGGNNGALGGTGGSISGVTARVSVRVGLLAAGDGGVGLDQGGAGGSVTGVQVNGDLGDIANPASTGLRSGLGGGSLNGTPGLNGGVSNITALRIASILAGQPSASAFTAANAVYFLTGVRTRLAGGDINGDGVFAFADNNGNGSYNLGVNDTAIDGPIIARFAGFQPIVDPLTGDRVTPLKYFLT